MTPVWTSKDAMIAALGEGAEAFAYTTFGDRDSPWFGEAWRAGDGTGVRYGVYGEGPEPFAAVLEDLAGEDDEGWAVQAANTALAKVVLDCVAATPELAALEWRRDNGDALAVACAPDGEWHAAWCFDGEYDQVGCGDDLGEAWRPAAEAVLRAGLVDETDEDAFAGEADLRTALAVEAWAAAVLSDATADRMRAAGCKGDEGFRTGM
ncbi:hypothetical protein ABT160_18895 [Streptomyces sp. NPDC001941]|uniref:hypothetical protein n=1 Tax=Streptomyces sp. NPDC001941 TaxID=3154659 RepID=UPI00332322FA